MPARNPQLSVIYPLPSYRGEALLLKYLELQHGTPVRLLQLPVLFGSFLAPLNNGISDWHPTSSIMRWVKELEVRAFISIEPGLGTDSLITISDLGLNRAAGIGLAPGL